MAGELAEVECAGLTAAPHADMVSARGATASRHDLERADAGAKSAAIAAAPLATSQLLVGPLREQILASLAASSANETVMRTEPRGLDNLGETPDGIRVSMDAATPPFPASVSSGITDNGPMSSDSGLRPQRVHAAATPRTRAKGAWVVTAGPPGAGARDGASSGNGTASTGVTSRKRRSRESRARSHRSGEPDLGALDGRLVKTQHTVADMASAMPSDVFAATSEAGQNVVSQSMVGHISGRRLPVLIVAGLVVVGVLAWLAMKQLA